MKRRTLVSLAVAGALGFSASAFAGPGGGFGHEVKTPSAVNESAPWLAGEPHLGGQSEPMLTAGIDYSLDTHASVGASGTGEGSYIASTTASSGDFGHDSVGLSSSEAGSGEVSFSSESSGLGGEQAFSSDSLESGDELASADTEVWIADASDSGFETYWSEEVASIEDLDRVMTENVFVMIEADDAIGDSEMVAAAPEADVFASADLGSFGEQSSDSES